MPNNEEKWWKSQPYSNIEEVEEGRVVVELDILKIITEAERLGQITALEWLNKNASGGGDWRMKIVLKLDELKKL